MQRRIPPGRSFSYMAPTLAPILAALHVTGCVDLGSHGQPNGRRSFGNEPTKEVAFPHPEPGKENYGNEYRPNDRGVFWNLFKRTVNITEDRNAEDDVDPAKDPTCRAPVHDVCCIGCHDVTPRI